MRKILVTVAILIFFTSCGGKDKPEKESNLQFPVNVLLLQVMGSDQIRVDKDGIETTILIGKEAKIIFNEKEVERVSLTAGQRLYIEGGLIEDNLQASKIVITEWPGNRIKGKDILIDIKNISTMISGYLEKNRPIMGFNAADYWEPVTTKIPTLPQGRKMSHFINGTNLMIVTYDDLQYPEFTVLINKAGSEMATWSGTVHSDGYIEEFSYEGP